jgi:hypothetical protein
MCPIHEAIEVGALPPELDHEMRTKSLRDSVQRVDRHAAETADLAPRDRVARQLRPTAEIRLAPAVMAPEQTDRARDVRPKHAPMMGKATYRPVTIGPMTYEELIALARSMAGRRLETVTGKGFSVGVALDCPFFTPESSGCGQSDGRKAAERFLARYTATGSLRPGDYADVTRNASYYVGMLLAGGEPDGSPPEPASRSPSSTGDLR